MRRTTRGQCIEQETKLLIGLFFTNAQQLKNGLLHLRAIDTNGAPTQFGAIKHHIISTRQRLVRIFPQHFWRTRGCSERVVQRVQVTFLVTLKHWEVDHPQWSPAFSYLTKISGNFQTQCSNGLINNTCLVSAEEYDVASGCLQTLKNLFNNLLGHKLDDRRLQTFQTGIDIIDLDPGQALGTVNAHKFCVIVDILAAKRHAVGHAQRNHTTVRVIGWAGKHFEVDRCHQIGNVDKFKIIAQIRLI